MTKFAPLIVPVNVASVPLTTPLDNNLAVVVEPAVTKFAPLILPLK